MLCSVASVVSDSVRPHRWQPTGLPHPWDSPGKNIGVGCHFLLQCMKVKSESEVSQLCLTPWTAAYQAPPSMGFSRHNPYQNTNGIFYRTNTNNFKNLNILVPLLNNPFTNISYQESYSLLILPE